MPPKRNKSKISFKIFSSENYSKFANRFPFLEERQIKAKLLQAWRNRFTTDTTKAKGEIKITKHRREASPFNEAKLDTPAASQEDALDKTPRCSPLRTYADRRYNNGKPNQTASATNDKCNWICVSDASKMDDNKALNELQTGTERNKQIHLQNELIDLFGEINAEQLLIEPEDVSEADGEFITSAPGYFDHKEWFQKLNEEEQDEKKTNTVSGMFKWRADKKRKISEESEKKDSCDSRFLESNESEGCGNFFSMFDEEEDIFL